MLRLLPRWLVLAVATGLLLDAGSTQAQVDAPPSAVEVHFFAADTSDAGVISLYFFGALGRPVTFYEKVAGKLQPLGTRTTAGDPTRLVDAVTWRCDRLVREFAASAPIADGTLAAGSYSVRTSSCDTRLELRVPRRVEPGAVGRVRVIDRWGNGAIAPRLCITPPGGKRDCSQRRMRRAVSVLTYRFRAARSGRWLVQLHYRGHEVRRTIAVGDGARASTPPPTVLATGDSSLQGVDTLLADELGDRATVRSDIRPGTGIAKPLGPWATLARKQTDRLRQSATVVSLGVVDGFPLEQEQCCGAGWIALYTRRVRAMMRTYSRAGRGRVLWLTLPIPRGRRELSDAVNAAVVDAAKGLERVTVLRMDLVFTPDGYRDRMPYRGRLVDVREEDGIHLNITGAAIAAALVAQAIGTR